MGGSASLDAQFVGLDNRRRPAVVVVTPERQRRGAVASAHDQVAVAITVDVHGHRGRGFDGGGWGRQHTARRAVNAVPFDHWLGGRSAGEEKDEDEEAGALRGHGAGGKENSART